MNTKNLTFQGKRILIFYICLFFVALIVHLLLPLDWADDAVFYKKTIILNLSEFLEGSARPLVDTFTYIFVKYPIMWRILNPLILVVQSVLLSIYLPQSKNEFVKNVILCFLLLFPSMVMVDAGFIATTLNYLWTVTLGLLCLLPTYKKITERKSSFIEMILFIPCLLYATNMQQMAVVLVVLFGIVNVYLGLKRDFSPYIFFQFLISVACSVYSYLINTIGDNPRMLRETTRYFPEFSDLSFFEKLELGFSSTFYCLTMEHRIVWFGFFSFLCVLLYQTYKKSRSFLNRFIACFSVVLAVFGFIQAFFSEEEMPLKSFIPGCLQNYGLGKAVYSPDIITDAVFVLIVFCILYLLHILINNKRIYVISCTLFFLGLGSRMLMGFSPTVWASGYRTFYIMFISFIVVSFLVINENQKTDKNIRNISD